MSIAQTVVVGCVTRHFEFLTAQTHCRASTCNSCLNHNKVIFYFDHHYMYSAHWWFYASNWCNINVVCIVAKVFYYLITVNINNSCFQNIFCACYFTCQAFQTKIVITKFHSYYLQFNNKNHMSRSIILLNVLWNSKVKIWYIKFIDVVKFV